jgi:hypothetical protein
VTRPRPRRAKAATRVDVRIKDDPATVLKKGVVMWVAWAVGALVAAYAGWSAYLGLGGPKFATYEYVGGQIRQVVEPIASKVDSQGIYIISGRIETLKASRQQQLDARSRLDLQSHTTKDPVAIQIIAGQQKSIDDVVKSIDNQVLELSSQLKALQGH